MAEPRRVKLTGHGVLHLELEIDQEDVPFYGDTENHPPIGRTRLSPRFKLALHFDREDDNHPREFHTQGVLVPEVREGHVVMFCTRAPDGDIGRGAWEYDAAKLVDVADKYLHLTTDRRDRLYVVTATADLDIRHGYEVTRTHNASESGPRTGKWDVAAYWDKEQADDHVKKVTERVTDYGPEWVDVETSPEPFDPNLKNHHRNVRYAVKEVTVWRHVDEYLENT